MSFPVFKLKMEKENKLMKLASFHYARKEVQEAIFNFCKNREVVVRYYEKFGKRPDTLEYPSDIIQYVRNNATSFHCSEEIWSDPLQLSTNLSREDLDNLRTGFDLLIDIDSKYLDYSKITAELLIKALEFHEVRNIGIKFSGNKGFHIIIPWKAFPSELAGQQTKNMFPEWPRIICQYLSEIIKNELIEKITNLTTNLDYIKDFEAAKKVAPDIILVSSRHLFRAPYSLHEKTSLASVVLDKNEIVNFQPKMAHPLRIEIKNFYPNAKESEAKELLISALDWYKEKTKEKTAQKNYNKTKEIKIDKSRISYPPCISLIMKGLPDGKKRAVFILINYFRSLGLEWEEIEKKLQDWNNLNKPQLREGYIKTQISWHKKQKKMLPPNCNSDWYKGIGVCSEEIKDDLCRIIKNPVNYSIKKQKTK